MSTRPTAGWARDEQPEARRSLRFPGARVFDREGRFVTDLSVEDFEILEKGAVQKIQTMFLVGGPAVSASMPSASTAPILPRAAGDLAGVVMNDKMVNNRISSVRSEFLDALQQVTAPADAIWRAQDQEDAARTGGEGEPGATSGPHLESNPARR